MTIQAIETRYKGYRFRSRLEARWAIFFDTLGIRWEYEVEGFEIIGHQNTKTQYLPDFWLPQKRWFVEVKPSGIDPEDFGKTMAAAAHGDLAVLLLWGSDFESYAGHLMLPSEKDGVFRVVEFLQWSICPICSTAGLFTIKSEPPLTFECLNPECVGFHGLTINKLVEWQTPSIKAAMNAARSARFEHGETPKVPRGKPRQMTGA